MKTINLLWILGLSTITAFGQNFEEPKLASDSTQKAKVTLGGDFALQYQVIQHKVDADALQKNSVTGKESPLRLVNLGTGFVLPTANMKINSILAPGIKLNIELYLSARHHNETWVKGGYLLIDKMPFINSDVIDNLMNYLTFKVGVMEINYGDAHFRRSDNGNVINNPFVGNYITDAFTTAPSMEIYYRNNGLFAMAAASTGSLKPELAKYSAKDSIYSDYYTEDELAFYGKIGYDKQLSDDLHFRATFSVFTCPETHNSTLYNGDRAGSRYYLTMKPVTYNATDVDPASGHQSGNYLPGSAIKDNSYMGNLFLKYKGAELFGTYESVALTNSTIKTTKFDQMAIEGLYRFGKNEQFYAGIRYNKVTGKEDNTPTYVLNKVSTTVNEKTDVDINRVQVVAGWYLLKSTLVKVEYVKQTYNKDKLYKGGEFKGLMVEAAISF